MNSKGKATRHNTTITDCLIFCDWFCTKFNKRNWQSTNSIFDNRQNKKFFGEGTSIEVSHALTYRNPGGIAVESNRTTSLLAGLTRGSTAINCL